MSVASSCETATTKSALSYFNFVNVGRDSPASLPPPVLTAEFLARRPSRIRCLCPLRSEANFAAKCMRSEEHTSGLQSLMRTSYDVVCLIKQSNHHIQYLYHTPHH